MKQDHQFWIYFWTIFFAFVIGLVLTINYCVSQSGEREQERMLTCIKTGKSWTGRDINTDKDYGPEYVMECK